MAEGEGFEPSIPVTRDKRLAGARTRPLCDPSRGCAHSNMQPWGELLPPWPRRTAVAHRPLFAE